MPRDRAESGKNFARACDLGMQYACPSLVALVKRKRAGRIPLLVRSGRRRELFYSGIALLCGQRCAERIGHRGHVIPAILRRWMVARLRRAGGILPRRTGDTVGCGASLGVFRKGLPRRRGRKLFRRRHHVPRHEGRSQGPAAIPAGLRGKRQAPDCQHRVLPGRGCRTCGDGPGVLLASRAVSYLGTLVDCEATALHLPFCFTNTSVQTSQHLCVRSAPNQKRTTR